jgi:AcrR family transcriptional regulator
MARAPERAARSDAVRNRARLTEVAAAAFRDEGLDVGVDELARRAGVGIATLYRHFPAKTDLIHAVIDLVLDDLEALATQALRSRDPVARFLRSALALQRENGTLLETLAEHRLPEDLRRRLDQRARTILAPIVAAGHQSGAIRPELDAADVLVVVRMLGVAANASRRRSAQRYLKLVLRGLATDA